MTTHYTAQIRQDGDWWIGWIQEIPGVNAQERTQVDLLDSLRAALGEAIEMNREEARNLFADNHYQEIAIAV